MKTLVYIVLGTISALLLSWVLLISLNKQAVVDCEALQKQATQYPAYNPTTQTGFFISKSQQEECASVHMTVNAPVVDIVSIGSGHFEN